MFIVPFFGQLRGRRGTHGGWIMNQLFLQKNDFKFTQKKGSSRDLGFD
jgi:hypothetical protein